MSEYPPFSNNLPLKNAPYYSRVSTTFDKSYPLLAFKPGFALQASELNEIQENFYVQKTLSDSLLSNWWKTGSNTELTGSPIDILYGPGWEGAIPLSPNFLLENNIERLSAGLFQFTFPQENFWFLVTDPVSKLKFWQNININSSNFSFSIFTPIDKTTIVGIQIETPSIVPCSSDSDNEGYFFNDNSSGNYIENTCGASRYKLKFQQWRFYTTDSSPPSNFLPIWEIKVNVDISTQGKYAIRYLNNYFIKGGTL